MVHGAVRHLFQFLGAAIVALLVAIPLFVWRLAAGPVSLDALTPYVQSLLTDRDSEGRVTLGGTVLALAEDRRMIEIRAVDVHMLAADGHLVATVPQMAVTLDPHALLRGVLEPGSIRIYGAQMRVVRDVSGRFLWGIGESGSASAAPAPLAGAAPPAPETVTDEAGGVVAAIVGALVGAPDPGKPGRHLNRADLVGARIEIDDRKEGVLWRFSQVNLSLRRQPNGLAASARLTLDLDGDTGTLEAQATYGTATDALAGEVRLTGIRPSRLARLGGPLVALAGLDFPVSGVVRWSGTTAAPPQSLTFDLSAGPGTLDLPTPLALSHALAGASLRGAFSKGMTRIDVETLKIDLRGPVLTVSGGADGLGGDIALSATAGLRTLPLDALATLWPPGLAPDPRNWVLHNLTHGMVEEGRLDLAARIPAGHPEAATVDRIGGSLRVSGATVAYLDPMPPVRDVAASATFDAKAFRIAIASGRIGNLSLMSGGTVVLGGLDARLQTADIDITVKGPVAEALSLIDNPPLRYASTLGLKPAAVGGSATTRLALKFPLLSSLNRKDLNVHAHADLTGARMPGVLMGLDLSQGDLALDVDGNGLDMTGTMVLGTIPAHLSWRENFASRGVPFRSRYVLEAASVDQTQRAALGLDGVPFVAPWIDGPIDVSAVATLQPGGAAMVDLKGDLSHAAMALPGLGWRKPVGAPGSLEATVRIEHDRVAAVPRFLVRAGTLVAQGSVGFDVGGRARAVDFQKLAYDRTDMTGTVGLRPDGGLDITLQGSAFDVRSLLSPSEGAASGGVSAPSASGADGQGTGGKAAKKGDGLPPMTLSAGFGRLWLSDDGALRDVSLHAQHDARVWRTMTLAGTAGMDKAFSATLRPGEPGRRLLEARSDDAGSVFAAFGISDHVVGGRLSVRGAIDDTRDDSPVSGRLSIADYSVTNAPALARLLTVTALTGILDLLRGNGISFSSLDAPFTLADGVLTVKDARTAGSALGLTAQGEIDLDRNRIAMEGTLVPAYTLNSALGDIPVLGWLVTGGEKGGGLLAFNYSMTGNVDDPDVVVNPLAALTPGFLRHLFAVFDDGSETEVRRKEGGGDGGTPSNSSAPATPPAPSSP